MKTIEISEQAAKDWLPLLEDKLLALDAQIGSLQQDYDSLKTTIAELRAKLAGELPLKNGEGIRQRRPKGYAKSAVEALLESLPEGQGLTMAQITKRTGLNHSSIFRTLKDPKRNQGRFTETNNIWRLKK